jgi:transmembrane sensor
MKGNFDATSLIKKYKAGTCTPEEKLLVELWYEELPDQKFDLAPLLLEEDLNEVWGKLSTDIKPHKRVLNPKLLFKAAAIFFAGMLLFEGVFFYSKTAEVKRDNFVKTSIKPGGHKATLTLADGSIIILDKIDKGPFLNEKGIIVSKTGVGGISYYPVNNSTNKGQIASSHRVSTPIGGQYQVVLPDGSNAWLNAASSITYPVYFGHNTRRVNITGEVYFEIAKNKEKPFVVSVNNMHVKVLGTHFNISAYPEDNSIATTLFEGAVEVSTPNDHTGIKPGQIAKWDKGQGKIKKIPADLEAALAWKNGYFIFNDEHITSIMLKLSRWYNVEVSYLGNVTGLNFSAKISRRSNISEVLEIFQSTGTIKFKVEGRRIIVTK